MSGALQADLDWFALLWRVCDGVAAPVECAQLDEILHNDADARRQYLYYVALVSDLGSEGNAAPRALVTGMSHDAGSERAGALPPAAEGGLRKTSVLGFLRPIATSLAQFDLTSRVLVIAISSLLTGYFAIVLGMVAWDHVRRAGEVSESRQAVARVSEAMVSEAMVSAERNIRWAGAESSKVGQKLATGSLRLQQGAVEFTLGGGTRVVVEGPAEFEVVNEARIRLGRGRLLAQVPKSAVGFTVAAPTAEVVDLGTEFDVEVDSGGSTDVHVVTGRVEVKPADKRGTARSGGRAIVAGQAIRVAIGDPTPVRIEYSGAHFEAVRSEMVAAAARKPTVDDFLRGAPIWLGNLFDDPPSTRLTDAVHTDTYKAVPKGHATLGVERVFHAGKFIGSDDGAEFWDGTGKLQIAPHLVLEVATLGWKGIRSGGICNDAYSRYEGTLIPTGGISTRNTLPVAQDAPKIEEGIGMQADAMLTFDLDEIRAAGDLAGRKMVFWSVHAGIADGQQAPRNVASVYMLAIVSTASGEVVAAQCNGSNVRMIEHDDVWSVAELPGRPLNGLDDPVPFLVRIPADARYLTLVTTIAGDTNRMDISVWSGACLKVVP